MKNIIKNISFVCLALSLFSCQEKYDVYDLPENKLGFTYGYDSFGDAIDYSVKPVSFVYKSSEVMTDTVWIEMATSVFVTEHDRTFEVEQVQFTSKDPEMEDVQNVVNAEAGKHYVPFTDSGIAKYMVVKAGDNFARFPLVLKRDDPFLQEGSVYMKLKLKSNENFQESFEANRFYSVSVTNKLVQPTQWDLMEYYFAGTYGPAKLRFMIDAATWTINEKWFVDNFGNYSVVDMGYTGYLSTYYTNKLIETNRARQAQGLDPLKEEDGTIVQFASNGTPQPYI